MTILTILLEANERRVLLYWQQQAIDTLPDSADISIEGDSLVIVLDDIHVKLKPPANEAVKWEALEMFNNGVHWQKHVAKLLPPRYSAKLIVNDEARTKKSLLRVQLLQNDKPLCELTTPETPDPNDFSNYFGVSGDDVIDGNIVLSGANLKERLEHLLKAFEFRRKLLNLTSAAAIRDLRRPALGIRSTCSLRKVDKSAVLEVVLYPGDSFSGSVITKLATEPKLSYSVFFKRHLGAQQSIGSSVSEDKALDLVVKGMKLADK